MKFGNDQHIKDNIDQTFTELMRRGTSGLSNARVEVSITNERVKNAESRMSVKNFLLTSIGMNPSTDVEAAATNTTESRQPRIA